MHAGPASQFPASFRLIPTESPPIPQDSLSGLPTARGTPQDLCEIFWKDQFTTSPELSQRPPAGLKNTLTAMHLSNLLVEFQRFQTKKEERLRLVDLPIDEYEISGPIAQHMETRISNPELLKSFACGGFLKGLTVLQSATRCCPELLTRKPGILEEEDMIVQVDHNKTCRTTKFGLHGYTAVASSFHPAPTGVHVVYAEGYAVFFIPSPIQNFR